LGRCAARTVSIADAVFANELTTRTGEEVRAGIDTIADTMLA
jgi:L-serine deaminase